MHVISLLNYKHHYRNWFKFASWGGFSLALQHGGSSFECDVNPILQVQADPMGVSCHSPLFSRLDWNPASSWVRGSVCVCVCMCVCVCVCVCVWASEQEKGRSHGKLAPPVHPKYSGVNSWVLCQGVNYLTINYLWKKRKWRVFNTKLVDHTTK